MATPCFQLHINNKAKMILYVRVNLAEGDKSLINLFEFYIERFYKSDFKLLIRDFLNNFIRNVITN